jgi:acyl-CoA thioesterase FadM
MMATEEVVSAVPFVMRRRVKWGECDPAGVVYTVVFAEYVMAAAELFYASLWNAPLQEMKRVHGIDTPTRALHFEFVHVMRPDDDFTMTVAVANIRRSSYVLDIAARTLDGEDVFAARLTPVCIASHMRKSIAIPPAFRQVLSSYRSACEASTGSEIVS